MSATVLTVGPPTDLLTSTGTVAPAPCDLAIGQDGEFVLTPTGDLATVSGAARLAQDVWMLAVTPLGAAVIDPTYGDVFAGMVGGRMPDGAQLAAGVAGLEHALSTLQNKRTAEGNPPGAGEGLDSIAVDAAASAGNALTVAVTVRTTAGQSVGVRLPTSGATA